MTKILYVEDNEDNIYMLTNRLGRNGYEVVVAKDGREGVRMSETELPDLIIMDLRLPVLDGWQAIRQIKSSPDTEQIPIIVLTAHAMSSDRDQALDAGCNDFATKPVDLAHLLEKIDAQMKGRARS